MARFIKVPTVSGSDIIVNVDQILFATPTDGGLFLTFKIKESGQHDGVHGALSLAEFLIIANDER